jgi:hypothetical protein
MTTGASEIVQLTGALIGLRAPQAAAPPGGPQLGARRVRAAEAPLSAAASGCTGEWPAWGVARHTPMPVRGRSRAARPR